MSARSLRLIGITANPSKINVSLALAPFFPVLSLSQPLWRRVVITVILIIALHNYQAHRLPSARDSRVPLVGTSFPYLGANRTVEEKSSGLMQLTLELSSEGRRGTAKLFFHRYKVVRRFHKNSSVSSSSSCSPLPRSAWSELFLIIILRVQRVRRCILSEF